MNWIEDFLQHLEAATNGILKVTINGETIQAKISKDLISFLKSNKDLLLRIGKDVFRSFLLLVSEKKNEQAFGLLLAKMDADNIILRMEMNAISLSELNKNKEDFIASLKKLMKDTLLPITVKVLVGLLI